MAKIYPDYSPINAFVKAGLPVIAAMSSVTALLSNPRLNMNKTRMSKCMK